MNGLPNKQQKDAPESYIRMLHAVGEAATCYRLPPSVSESVPMAASRVSLSLLESSRSRCCRSNECEAAALIDGLVLALKGIASCLEVYCADDEPTTDETGRIYMAYRTAKALGVE